MLRWRFKVGSEGSEGRRGTVKEDCVENKRMRECDGR